MKWEGGRPLVCTGIRRTSWASFTVMAFTLAPVNTLKAACIPRKHHTQVLTGSTKHASKPAGQGELAGWQAGKQGRSDLFLPNLRSASL